MPTLICKSKYNAYFFFFWLQLVMASDKLESVQEPLVSLDLDVQGQPENRHVSIEMNKDDLGKLMTTLEAANKVGIAEYIMKNIPCNIYSGSGIGVGL